jgi:hypothetical protein
MNDRTSSPDPAVPLSELRRRLGRSQAEVASVVGTTQSGISRIERQPDLRLSTLGEYVAALGGRLHLVVEHGAIRTEIALPWLQQVTTETRRREYRVIWQDHVARSLVHVGWLVFAGDLFQFSYTEDAKSHPNFSPFPAFPSFHDKYESTDLFSFFLVRLINTADPEFDAVIDALGLTRAQATPAELLARSPSESPHDTIQVVPAPTELPDGQLRHLFLVSGIRHAHEQDPERVGRVVDTLDPGDRLQLVPEPANPVNPQALQLAAKGTVIGWVPNYLVDEIHTYLQRTRQLDFEVERANGPETPWHFRVLCQMIVEPPPSRLTDSPGGPCAPVPSGNG